MRQETGYSGSKAKTKSLSDCVICQSSFRKEIEKRNVESKSDQTIKWAKERGIKLSKTVLAKHHKDHKQSKSGTRKANPVNKTSSSRKTLAPKTTDKSKVQVSDLEFLDAVRDSVYSKLIDGGLELKIDSGFKAIELKNKLSDGSENEKLLLKILSEIRKEELDRAQL